ncbi:hypothetical protein GKR67_14415 [Providencia alcalifaciens]|uniref:Bacteriophage protein n=1 Tax=Providencia alcalifaciens TaxID=126385 RepID=A0AAW9VE26_9GAMM|nr:hypothetical protein [Providencia alcalifaciens]
MKYIVAKGAKLSFPDGSHFDLLEGIHDSAEFSKQVTEHWAFAAYAKPLDESELQKEEENKNMGVKIQSLEEEITALKAALKEKDDLIASQSDEISTLKAASSAETKSDKKQGAGDGKKQSSADN